MERTIRVAHIIAPLGIYGKENWLLAFMRHFDRASMEVSVIVLSAHEQCPLAERLAELDIPVDSIKSPAALRIGYVREIRRRVRERRIEIIHTHDYKSDVLGLLASVGTGARTVSTPHGWCARGDVKLALYEEIDRLFLAFFDRVAPLSSPMASTLRVVPRNKVRIINNFVDLDALPPAKSNRGNVVTYIGRLVGLKRVEDIIHAMTFIRDGDARLQIVGDGPLRRRYESLAQSLGLQDRIAFLGYRNDQLALLNESRILVLPSESEGISRAAMEGMALERVIIGTNIPGIRELVVDGKNGFLVDVGRPREIADRIDHVFSHPDEADRLAREGRLTIERSFSAAAAVRHYEHLYRELVP